MKNIHLLPTDKPSRLTILHDDKLHLGTSFKLDINVRPQNIYITSDEEIKEDDWLLIIDDFETYVHKHKGDNLPTTYHKKIILTDNQDLIKDGVQAIDDEFLEWFVKNPSCEEVEIKKDEFYCKNDFINGKDAITYNYKIIIPKEELTVSDEAKQRAKNYMFLKGALEPKQETLEEAAARHFNKEDLVEGVNIQYVLQCAFIQGANWQAKRMYSEEDVENILIEYVKTNPTKPYRVVSWFKQFKKK